MKRYFFAMLLAVVGILPATAQTDNKSFEDFRKSINKEFQSFRKKVLDDYAEFLDGVWKEYNSFKAEERDTTPKPVKQPVMPKDVVPQQTPPKQDLTPKEKPPQPVVPKPDSPAKDVKPDFPKVDIPQLGDKKPDIPKIEPQPAEPPMPARKNTKFMYHSVAFEVPEIELDALPAGVAPEDFAKLWREFSSLKLEKKVLPAIAKTASDCKFNDWFLSEAIRSYADNVMASMQPGQRIALSHYLLAHMGFDARIGLSESQEPILLIALEQEVYGRVFSTLNDKKYYMFFDNLTAHDAKKPRPFRTCEIPTNVDCGKRVDLLIQEEPKVPYEAHAYSFTYDGMHIEGNVNANLMPMLYHYPQMQIADFAQSVVSKSIQEDVANQIASQLKEMPKLDAVNKLLKFIQKAFAYATDEESHGFEKPYFFEEMLYYPKCDCEDRSLFYSYLLKSVLGVENHLIYYPGHESVSVNLGQTINGHGYKFDNKTFYISDPTYIGATTGMCMSDFVNINPEIDFQR